MRAAPTRLASKRRYLPLPDVLHAEPAGVDQLVCQKLATGRQILAAQPAACHVGCLRGLGGITANFGIGHGEPCQFVAGNFPSRCSCPAPANQSARNFSKVGTRIATRIIPCRAESPSSPALPRLPVLGLYRGWSLSTSSWRARNALAVAGTLARDQEGARRRGRAYLRSTPRPAAQARLARQHQGRQQKNPVKFALIVHVLSHLTLAHERARPSGEHAGETLVFRARRGDAESWPPGWRSPPPALAAAAASVEEHLAGLLAPLPPGVLAFCSPVRNEFDARPLVARSCSTRDGHAMPWSWPRARQCTFVHGRLHRR